MSGFLGVLLLVQAQAIAPVAPPTVAPTTVRAARVTEPPVIDGRGDDAVWREAMVITQFRQARPTEGGEARFRTEARVAYDPDHLYVLVRAFDPHPDSIVGLLSRRDDQTASDQIILMLDSWHDRRSGFEFAVNPAGVKADYAIYNDGNEDVAWDAVWDAEARVDSLGWTVEYRIPLSQLHYAGRDAGTFGILVWRLIQRHGETVTWPLYRGSQSGFVSQFGELTDLRGLSSPGHVEVAPYLVTKNVSGPASKGYPRDQEFTAGGDLRLRLASNLMLNATVNPDFGQVEADPSELNLSALESFFREQRPFFVEGKGLFTFNVNCVVVVDCSTGEGLFYSRRVGRAPQLAGRYSAGNERPTTRILGAAKLTGRLPGGFSLGFFDAVTGQVEGAHDTTLEPATNYAVLRVNQDGDGGNSSVGAMFTAVHRSLDGASSPFLRREAYSSGLDARRRFGGRWELSGSLAFSRVEGSAAAIARTQRDPVHLYQRPDGALEYDSTRTSLSGSNLEFRVAKVGGKRLRFETAYQRRTPGFEINDIGFLRQADRQAWTSWAQLAFRDPTPTFRQLRWNFNNWDYWSIAGLPTERAVNTNVHIELHNRWWLHAGGTLGQLGATYCDRCARGGPAIRQDPYIAPWFGIEGDGRRRLVPYLWINYSRRDEGRSESLRLSPELALKLSSRFNSGVSVSYAWDRNDTQYYGTFTDSLTGVSSFTFAHLRQRTLSLTWRLDYTFTPTATLQLYASPFVTRGTYTRVRELEDPRAARYADRYQPYADSTVTADPGGFNFQQFRSNVVFRWEYRPGSTLFLVWGQGREHEADREGGQSFGADLRHLFRRRADNTFLLKVSYWLAK